MRAFGVFALGVFACVRLVATGFAQAEEPAPPVAPPSAAPKRSAADLEKLVAPIALFPDTLLAVMLPASAYPVDVVLAARFVADPANLPNLDEQPWDVNVKAVARVPAAIKKMEDDLPWTVELGQAFIDQPLEVMDAIQRLRAEAKTAGTLKTTPEQVVTVNEATVEREYEGEVIYVTNSVIEIQPASPEVIYVPVYDPVKAYEPPPDDDDDDDDASAIVAFAAAVTLGAVIANNCDWYYGGVVIGGGGMVVIGGGGHPPYYPPPPYYRPPPYYPPPGYRPPPPGYRPPGVPPPGTRPPGNRPGGQPPTGTPPGATTSQLPGPGGAAGSPTTGQRWQPDQGRLAASGGSGAQASASTLEARGWGASPSSPAQSAAVPRNAGADRPAPASTSTFSAGSHSPSRSGAFAGVGGGGRDRDFSRRGASSRGGFGGGGRGGGRR